MKKKAKDTDGEEDEKAVDLTVEVVGADGYCAGLPLSDFGPIRSPCSWIGWGFGGNCEDARCQKLS